MSEAEALGLLWNIPYIQCLEAAQFAAAISMVISPESGEAILKELGIKMKKEVDTIPSVYEPAARATLLQFIKGKEKR
jgi:hypothetical protein